MKREESASLMGRYLYDGKGRYQCDKKVPLYMKGR